MTWGFVFSSPATRFGDYQFLGVDPALSEDDRARLETFICRHGRNLMDSRHPLILMPLADSRVALFQVRNGGADHAGRPDRVYAQGLVWREASDRLLASRPLSAIIGAIRLPTVADEGRVLPVLDRRELEEAPSWRAEILAAESDAPDLEALLARALEAEEARMLTPARLALAEVAQILFTPPAFLRHHWALPFESADRNHKTPPDRERARRETALRGPLVGAIADRQALDWWLQPPGYEALAAAVSNQLACDLLLARLETLPLATTDLPPLLRLLEGQAASWLRRPLLQALTAPANAQLLDRLVSPESLGKLLGKPAELEVDLGRDFLRALAGRERIRDLVVAYLCRTAGDWDRWQPLLSRLGLPHPDRPESVILKILRSLGRGAWALLRVLGRLLLWLLRLPFRGLLRRRRLRRLRALRRSRRPAPGRRSRARTGAAEAET
ncbi:MAG: hypothetical protein H6807_17555 [Planctomycetes bacterium]|nr:hypothetical protein [Planctomycetota bacterium]